MCITCSLRLRGCGLAEEADWLSGHHPLQIMIGLIGFGGTDAGLCEPFGDPK
jgi:hypothetical protein